MPSSAPPAVTLPSTCALNWNKNTLKLGLFSLNPVSHQKGYKVGEYLFSNLCHIHKKTTPCVSTRGFSYKSSIRPYGLNIIAPLECGWQHKPTQSPSPGVLPFCFSLFTPYQYFVLQSVQAPSKRLCACSALGLAYNSKFVRKMQYRICDGFKVSALADRAAAMIRNGGNRHHLLELFSLLRFHFFLLEWIWFFVLTERTQ